MEINQSATELLLKGTVVDGLPDWDQGRPQPVRFIDFENPANNDFLVINQFKVELTSGRGHVIPDAVLFVNGIPLVGGGVQESRHSEPAAGGHQPAPALLEPAHAKSVPHALHRERGRRAALPHQPAAHRQRLLRGARGDHRRAAGGVSGMGGHQPGADEHGGGGTGCCRASADADGSGSRNWPRSGRSSRSGSGTPLFFRTAGAAARRRCERLRVNAAEPADSGRRACCAGASARPDPQLHGVSAGGRQDAQGGGALPAVPRHPQGGEPTCRKAARERRARRATSAAASSGTRRARARASAWSSWCARCG